MDLQLENRRPKAPDNKLPLKYYYRTAGHLLRQIDVYRVEDNPYELYTFLLRFASLVMETIPKHRDYEREEYAAEKKEFLFKLMAALDEMEKLKPRVQRLIASSSQRRLQQQQQHQEKLPSYSLTLKGASDSSSGLPSWVQPEAVAERRENETRSSAPPSRAFSELTSTRELGGGALALATTATLTDARPRYEDPWKASAMSAMMMPVDLLSMPPSYTSHLSPHDRISSSSSVSNADGDGGGAIANTLFIPSIPRASPQTRSKHAILPPTGGSRSQREPSSFTIRANYPSFDILTSATPDLGSKSLMAQQTLQEQGPSIFPTASVCLSSSRSSGADAVDEIGLMTAEFGRNGWMDGQAVVDDDDDDDQRGMITVTTTTPTIGAPAPHHQQQNRNYHHNHSPRFGEVGQSAIQNGLRYPPSVPPMEVPVQTVAAVEGLDHPSCRPPSSLGPPVDAAADSWDSIGGYGMVEVQLPPSNVADPRPGKGGHGTEEKSVKPLHVARKMMDEFLRLAKSNTLKNLETCAVLAGSLKKGVFYVSTLIIPKQESTSDSCQTVNEEEIFDLQDKRGLFQLGWIHTHPTQTCFMSSVDLHTHYSYQVMLPEAIAIVMAPTDCSREYGIFRLTVPGGVKTIQNCQRRGFHPHEALPDGGPIYESCSHVYLNSQLSFDVVDLRRR